MSELWSWVQHSPSFPLYYPGRILTVFSQSLATILSCQASVNAVPQRHGLATGSLEGSVTTHALTLQPGTPAGRVRASLISTGSTGLFSTTPSPPHILEPSLATHYLFPQNTAKVNLVQ
jgi:hypothetical protein